MIPLHYTNCYQCVGALNGDLRLFSCLLKLCFALTTYNTVGNLWAELIISMLSCVFMFVKCPDLVYTSQGLSALFVFQVPFCVRESMYVFIMHIKDLSTHQHATSICKALGHPLYLRYSTYIASFPGSSLALKKIKTFFISHLGEGRRWERGYI